MTEKEMLKAANALKLWRLTEKEMIANKGDAMKRQSHELARANARNIGDLLIKRGHP
ncbi:hypothetical protein [Undibacterium sp.]|uniref:hypothetical protein n=1 Tax=Undibacterium sp. TaxID=1914977 RepID=UPI0037509DA1